MINEHWFLPLEDAKEKIETWREDYNTNRPHSSIDFLAIASYSFFITIANILFFRILYTGKTNTYLLTNLLNAIFLLLAIWVWRIFGEIGSIIGLILGSAFYFVTV